MCSITSALKALLGLRITACRHAFPIRREDANPDLRVRCELNGASRQPIQHVHRHRGTLLFSACERQTIDAARLCFETDRFSAQGALYERIVRARSAALDKAALSKPVSYPNFKTRSCTASLATLPAAPGA